MTRRIRIAAALLAAFAALTATTTAGAAVARPSVADWKISPPPVAD